MANVQQGIHRDQSARLLGALLGSARRRERQRLRLRVMSARSARTDTNRLSYTSALQKFRGADAVDRPTFYQSYKVAISSAELASEAIIHAALEAGAKDQPIIAYVKDDFCGAVNAFMSTSFGRRPAAANRPQRSDELRALEENTSIQARALEHRVPELRIRFEGDRGGAVERLCRWLARIWRSE